MSPQVNSPSTTLVSVPGVGQVRLNRVYSARCDHSGIFLICCHMNFSNLFALFAYGVVSLLYLRQLSKISLESLMKSSGLGYRSLLSLSSIVDRSIGSLITS